MFDAGRFRVAMAAADLVDAQPRRETDWGLLRRILPYGYKHRRLLLVSMLLLIPAAIAGAVQPILVGDAISLVQQEPTQLPFLRNLPVLSGVNILAGLLLLTLVVRTVFEAWQGYLVQEVGQQITANIRDDLFYHVTSLAMRFFDRTPVGRLITRLTSDVEALGDVFSTGAIGIVGDLFSIVVIAIFMVLLQWQLALLLVVMLLPSTALIIYFQQQYRRANYKAREELSALNAMLQESIVGVSVVQLFRREAFNAGLFRKVNQHYVKEVDRTIFHDSAISATLEWISLVAIAVVLWVGGYAVLGKQLSFGTLSAFILYAQRLFDPLRQFAEKFTAIQAGLTAVERVSDVLAEPIEIRDSATPKSLYATPSDSDTEDGQSTQPDVAARTGEIRFEQVWFGYKPDDYVLQDLTFTIQPGEKVALVGPTGAGKSSIIRLLTRLYEPTRGSIQIDGIDVRELPQTELRRHMGVILQDGFIFAGDVKSNITLGETYSLDEVQVAAARTNIASLIEQLPHGYDTPLRERGTNLSGGQKQLLAFARAAIRDPKILVLDEATASLDVGTEALIQEALERLLENRTAIIVAHRLSTIRNCDRILVLKRGQLIESGSHEQLLAQGGLYASLYHLQMLEN
jgi:ATP-binding cassette, subfamily B, multidrug efflux pump